MMTHEDATTLRFEGNPTVTTVYLSDYDAPCRWRWVNGNIGWLTDINQANVFSWDLYAGELPECWREAAGGICTQANSLNAGVNEQMTLQEIRREVVVRCCTTAAWDTYIYPKLRAWIYRGKA